MVRILNRENLDGMLLQILSSIPGVRRVDMGREDYGDVTGVRILLRNGNTIQRQFSIYEFRHARDIEDYFRIVYRDVRREIERIEDERISALRLAGLATTAVAYRTSTVGELRSRLMPEWDARSAVSAVVGGPGMYQAASVHDEAPTKKSSELFKMAVGDAAYDTLNKGGSILIKGSAGGKYMMRKSMAYCITRVQDGAGMCALVPGVPIWDHLLGIKLIIEHDEELFMATANVTTATRVRDIIRFSNRSDPNVWI